MPWYGWMFVAFTLVTITIWLLDETAYHRRQARRALTLQRLRRSTRYTERTERTRRHDDR